MQIFIFGLHFVEKLYFQAISNPNASNSSFNRPKGRRRKMDGLSLIEDWTFFMPARNSSSAIVWFRRDLRLVDNPALDAAKATGKRLVLLYILEDADETKGQRKPGGATKWWLGQSLKSLAADIESLGGTLILRRGSPDIVLGNITKEANSDQVFWNRRYSQPERNQDASLKADLKLAGLNVESFNASLLTEPWTQKTGGGTYYKVYTPYWRSVQANYTPRPFIKKPSRLETLSLATENLTDFNLQPTAPDWSTGFKPLWSPGEKGAQARLTAFLSGPVNTYIDHRNRPDVETGTSGLSPHLAFGEIGPAQIWQATHNAIAHGDADETNATVFLKEIVWREFSYVLLYHNPALARDNYNPKFEHMPWRSDQKDYERWCRGQTGYPMVDAGMRQLWQTGWMHNRVRMIVASFLTKHLLLPWQQGETWFWDTLVDADPAANAASWQWTAGSGADAAPYFRVFNPITQGPKFDESGNYVRKYCPELAKLSTKYIHRPWEAAKTDLAEAGITIGKTYPAPIVAHKEGRERALAAYDILKKSNTEL